MVSAREKDVGRFKVEITVSNYEDVLAFRRGDLSADKVRRETILGVVDSGATRLVLPSAIAKKLGLEPSGKAKVKYANGSTAVRNIIESVFLEMQGRNGTFKAALEPKRETALIGAIVLEDLDFLVDCTAGKLYPRDPKYIVSEAE
ncbi:MAG TPA: retroviral-like aspartic protease family protein [Gemmataceae bacterium]|nr:retroviral-like aspartic protease family protein [Gemmataceae bacterium]